MSLFRHTTRPWLGKSTCRQMFPTRLLPIPLGHIWFDAGEVSCEFDSVGLHEESLATFQESNDQTTGAGVFNKIISCTKTPYYRVGLAEVGILGYKALIR